jgi:hypothetical protein
MRQERYEGWTISEGSEHPATVLVIDPSGEKTSYHYNDLDTFEEAVIRVKDYIDLINGNVPQPKSQHFQPLKWILIPIGWLIDLPSAIHRWKYRR